MQLKRGAVGTSGKCAGQQETTMNRAERLAILLPLCISQSLAIGGCSAENESAAAEEQVTVMETRSALEAIPPGTRRTLHELTASERAVLANAILDFITKPILDEHASAHDWHHPAVGELFFSRHHDYLSKLESYLKSNGLGAYVPLPMWDPSTPIPSEFMVADELVRRRTMNANPNQVMPERFRDLCAFSSASALAQDLENWHDGVHNAVGGSMAFLNESPATPIFWLWHGFLDDIYHTYQLCSSPPKPVGQIGVYRQGTWHLDVNGDHTWNNGDQTHNLGVAGDLPFVFDGGAAGCFGTLPSPAIIGTVRHPSSWFFTTGNFDWDASDDANTFVFGSNPLPVVWDSKPVAFENGVFHADVNGNHAWDSADVSHSFGQAGDQPVIGVWRSGQGQRVGVYRAGVWYLDFNGTNAWEDVGDRSVSFGAPDDLPVVIPFSDGVDRIATFRDGSWFVDANGNRRWDGADKGDLEWNFGTTGDIPVVVRGEWAPTSGACGH
jgi:hypothetical protein